MQRMYRVSTVGLLILSLSLPSLSACNRFNSVVQTGEKVVVLAEESALLARQTAIKFGHTREMQRLTSSLQKHLQNPRVQSVVGKISKETEQERRFLSSALEGALSTYQKLKAFNQSDVIIEKTYNATFDTLKQNASEYGYVAKQYNAKDLAAQITNLVSKTEEMREKAEERARGHLTSQEYLTLNDSERLSKLKQNLLGFLEQCSKERELLYNKSELADMADEIAKGEVLSQAIYSNSGFTQELASVRFEKTLFDEYINQTIDNTYFPLFKKEVQKQGVKISDNEIRKIATVAFYSDWHQWYENQQVQSQHKIESAR